MGRSFLYAHEIGAMTLVERIVKGYAEMMVSDRDKWTQNNKTLAGLFFAMSNDPDV